MADWLFDRYPEEMTIVIQHWFDALFVGEDGFQITLNFGDSPEPLSVPFAAMRTFVDPSVEFGLRFETNEEEKQDEDGSHEVVELPDAPEEEPQEDVEADATSSSKPADIVSLDSFRKT